MSVKDNKSIPGKRITIERIVILLLLITSIFFWYKGFSVGDGSSSKKYDLLDPELSIYPPEDFLVNIQPLREKLIEIETKNSDKVDMSLYLEFLNTGANISINKDMKIYPVSLAKLPLTMIVMKKVETRSINLDQKIEIMPEDINSESGELYKHVNERFTVAELIEFLLVDSDNTAFNSLRQLVNEEEIRAYIDSVGLEDLFKVDGKVSAKEYGRILRSLYSAVYVNQEYSEKILKLLSKTKFKGFLNQGIPSNITFAHKWGGDYPGEIYADSGIAYFENRPVMISVMIVGKDPDPYQSQKFAEALMKQVSEAITGYILEK
jgi:beta-lactamase class A